MSCLAGGSHSTHRSTIHHHSLASDMYCLIRSFTITRQYTLAFRVSFCIASQGDLQSPGNTPLLSELPFVLPHRAIYNHQAIHPCFQGSLLYCLTGSFTIIRQYTLLSEFPFVLPHRVIYNHQAIHLAFRVPFCIASQGDLQSSGNTLSLRMAPQRRLIIPFS